MIETVANKFEQNTVSYFLVTMNSSRQFIKKVGYSYSGNYENLDGSGSLIEDSEVESLNDSKIDGSDNP